MTGSRRLLAALAAASALGPAAAAQTAEDMLEAFRAGCLEQMPDFAGSAEAFASLGFVAENGAFRLEKPGEGMLAEVYERDIDAGGGCVVAAKLPPGADLTAPVARMVARLSGDDFRRRQAASGGKRVEGFSWSSGEWEFLIVVMPELSGMRALNVTVGEAAP